MVLAVEAAVQSCSKGIGALAESTKVAFNWMERSVSSLAYSELSPECVHLDLLLDLGVSTFPIHEIIRPPSDHETTL